MKRVQAASQQTSIFPERLQRPGRLCPVDDGGVRGNPQWITRRIVYARQIGAIRVFQQGESCTMS